MATKTKASEGKGKVSKIKASTTKGGLRVEVKKGGKQDYTCATCSGVIQKGEPHMRQGSKSPYIRTHMTCPTVKKTKEA
jgi:hypothetical protein